MKFQDEGPRLKKRFEVVGHPEEAEPSSSGAGRAVESDNETTTSEFSSTSSNSTGSAVTFGPPWGFHGLETLGVRDGGALTWFERPGLLPEGQGEQDDETTDDPIAITVMRLKMFESSGLSSLLFSPALQQRQLLHTFAGSLSPNEQSALPKIFRHHARFLDQLPQVLGTDALLDTAVRAVTLAHLGRLHGNETFMNEARPHYGKALRLLNVSLADPRKGFAAETLSAIVLLSFYEMFAGEEDESWVRHAGGAGTLMRLRGAAQFRFGFDREIYLAFRHALIIESFEKDRPCFLNEPAWRELAEQIHADVRATGVVRERAEIFDTSNEFFLEMVKVPEVLYIAKRLGEETKDAENQGETTADIKARALNHRANMKSIFLRFSAGVRNLGRAPRSYKSGDPAMPIYYEFDNIFIASLHIGYWTILIILNIVLIEIEPDTEAADLYALENREAALDCCRCEAFMETSTFLGPFFAVFGLRMALMVLGPPHERTWIIDKLVHLGNSNIAMAKHIPEYLRRAPPDAKHWVKYRKRIAKDRKMDGERIEELPERQKSAVD